MKNEEPVNVQYDENFLTSNHLQGNIYSTDDLQEFAEWCSKKLWEYSDKIERWRHPLYSSNTTSQLREMWELETGRRDK